MEGEQKKGQPPKILIVDDIDINVKILENIIEAEGYEALCALSVQEALDIMNDTLPQIILSDLSMPGMNGMEFCRLLKSNPITRDIPFIFITVADSREEKREAFSAGAVDFIPKPFEPVEVVMRVNNQLNSYRIRQEMENYNRMMHRMVDEQKKQMEKERESVLLALARVMGKRSVSMENHLERVGYNCRILARSLQLVPQYENQITDAFVETIATAAKLHNIGNLLIPDEVFLEEGRTDDGKGTIKFYAEEGAKILEEISAGNKNSRFLNMATVIARYHHAKWDGSGYPENVKGKDIPLEARIVGLINDFDTLLWKEPHGEGAIALEESVRVIHERSGSYYDPGIVEVFHKVLKQLKVGE